MPKAEKIKIKPFKDWLYEDVAKEFSLTRTRLEALDALDKAEYEPPHSFTSVYIETLKNNLNEYVDSWNEDELKMLFIAPFIALADFNSPYYKVFTQRTLKVKYSNDTLITEGRVDFMLAAGIQTPKKPHFFLHEYKPEKKRENDPLGQLLISMLASQKLNQDKKPVYGIYVTGRFWFFVILDGKKYAVSKSYSAEDEEIYKIFAMLLKLKEIMNALYKDV
jgi:hypothetical protein